MKSSTTYPYPNTTKNLFLLLAGSVGFFLLLVLLEPLSYFSHYKTSNNGPRQEGPQKTGSLVAAAMIAGTDSKNETKHTDSIAAAPLKSIEKAVRMHTIATNAAIVKAGRAWLKVNDARNNRILKELAQVTEMHEFHFRNGRYRPDQQALMNKLDSSIQKCIEAPDSWNKIIILGFTDNRGTKFANIKLGMKRAESFKALLIKKGIPAEKITVASFGSELAIASNNDEAGRARNRRVEINFTGGPAPGNPGN